MSDILQRLDQIISEQLKKTPVPQKTPKGIQVVSVLIVSRDHQKDLWRDDEKLYENIFLNISAISIATIMNRYTVSSEADVLYDIDQEYGKWYEESQRLKHLYDKSLLNKDYNRADILRARYLESRDRALSAKTRAESLYDF